MNAIQMTEKLHQDYIRYLMTTFDMSFWDRALTDELRRKLAAPGVLFRGPFLELNPPYQTGRSLRHLVAEGVLNERLCHLRGDIERAAERPLPPDRPLYLHQEKAIRRIVTADRNVVVASGTGSGKTESFLIPILNDLMEDNRPGVRAILIYPMNALVNDQLDRLRRLLRGTSITFGRYTSELENNESKGRSKNPQAPANEVVSREMIWGDEKKGQLPAPPQILITNYAMLEHLLIRPQDSPLFDSSQLRFLCLDEAHTYSGAQGIEVSMLLRRLKHRLGSQPGALRCIATSATLTENDRAAAATFARGLFGEEFSAEDVIFGTLTELGDEDSKSGSPTSVEAWQGISDELLEKLRMGVAAARTDRRLIDELLTGFEALGLVSGAQVEEVRSLPEGADIARILWLLFRHNPEIAGLRSRLREGTIELRRAGAVVFGDGGALPEDEQRFNEAVCRMVEIGALAREAPEMAALLPARYHLFARSPQGAWICLNPRCHEDEGRDGWSNLFLEKGESCPKCKCALYELVACRECGQPYVQAFEKNDLLHTESGVGDQATGRRYFTWRPLSDTFELDGEVEQDVNAEASTETSQVSVCLKCRQQRDRCECRRERCAVDLYRVDSKKGPIERMTTCPRCQSRAGSGSKEIVTPITVYNSAPLAVLTEELYRLSPPSPNSNLVRLPGAGRKLLAFTDSRQGAARFAAYLQAASDETRARHLIYEATSRLNRQGEQPDIIAVAEEAFLLDRRYQAAEGYLGHSKEREQKREQVNKLLVEFCTTHRRRHSLTSIGLIECSVDIREAEKPDGNLCEAFGLDQESMMVVVQVLLDRIRKVGAISLPEGTRSRDDVFSPGGIGTPFQRTKSLAEKSSKDYRIWINPEERHLRRQANFDYVWRLLQSMGREASVAEVQRLLNLFWEWATSRRILDSVLPGCYRLNHERLNFSARSTWYQCRSCQRLSTRRVSAQIPICPSNGCSGGLAPAGTVEAEEDDYYRSLFQQPVIPMRVEEHTAQLTPEAGREYQEDFINGRINVLSCSTTFEMGVDVGDLQTVLMSNVPPRVANYRQRAGRAGRRAGGTAFILTYASARPHDRAYFNDPESIIRGEVAVPYLCVDNQIIAERHRNAILLAHLLRWLRGQGRENLMNCGAFFDPNYSDGCHFNLVSEWRNETSTEVKALLAEFMARNQDISPGSPEGSLASFVDGLKRRKEDFERWLGQYTELRDHFNTISNRNSKESADAEKMRGQYKGFITTLLKEELVRFLCQEGLLPSYSFPIDVVSLRLPSWVIDAKGKEPSQWLRLDRDKQIAIVEYAPGAEVVADKRIWKSVGLNIRGQLNRYEYRICGTCNNLITGERGGLPTGSCQVCGSLSSGEVRAYIDPDGFTTDLTKTGEPAGKSVERGQNRSQAFLLAANQESRANQLPTVGPPVIEFSYRRDGQLMTINTGSDPDGFRICEKCGRMVDPTKVSSRKSKAENESTHRTALGEKACHGTSAQYGLGHRFKSDTLHLRFQNVEGLSVPGAGDKSFWRSLTYALLEGASLALQIERRDLDGLVSPFAIASLGDSEENFSQEIVLFDSVPGGAGHVRQVSEKMEAVLRRALQIAECPDCEEDTSCNSCLRNYGNQLFWPELKRGKVARFLENVINATFPENLEHLASGAARKVGADLPRWLSRELIGAEQKVLLAADRITVEQLLGDNRNWLDVLQEMLRQQVEVHLCLASLPGLDRQNIEDVRVRAHLLQLLQSGLHLHQIEASRRPEWNILIDPLGTRGRAIMVEGGDCVFDAQIGSKGMITTTSREGLAESGRRLLKLPVRTLKVADLEFPSSVRSREVRQGETLTERELFGEVFAKPVTEVTISDPYLCSNHHRERIAAYLEMIQAVPETVPQVRVQTKDIQVFRSNNHHHFKTRSEQEAMFRQLQQRFQDLKIRYDLVQDKHAIAHDRSIGLRRANGERARIVIGKGLDFIQYGGRTVRTFLFIEDPCDKK
jgi:hypothetical protein